MPGKVLGLRGQRGDVKAECMDRVWSCVPACTWGRGRDGPSELDDGPGSPTVPRVPYQDQLPGLNPAPGK